MELIWDWLKQWDCRQLLHNWTQSKSNLTCASVLLCVAWKPYCKPGFPCLIDHPWSKHTCARMSYERTNKSIDANKILQILTKLCFLFRWVIFNWISSSLHPPARAHPLKQHHLPQSGSFVISQSAKGNSESEKFVPQELSGYSAFWWWGWTQAILGGDVCQAGQGGLDGSHFSSWSTECLPSSMSCQLTLVFPPTKLTVFVCWLRAFFWLARIWVLIWK